MSIKPGWEGRYFEDFEVGDIYQCRLGRTVTEADNIWFTLLTMNTHPLHFDNDYAAKSEFGRPLVNSCLTLAIVTGMSVSDISQKAIGNLGWNDVKLVSPVYVGDTIAYSTEVIETRVSNSRPGSGLMVIRSTGVNQNGEPVISFASTTFVERRPEKP